MGIIKTFALESRGAAEHAHYQYRERHKHAPDFDDPQAVAELMRDAQEQMAEMGWGKPEEQSERTIRDLESEVFGLEYEDDELDW